ncbi:MAG: SpoIIE family protein phosphatase [Victivallaceae bacterium]
MRLRTKISLVNVTILLFAAIITLYIAITDILENSDRNIRQSEQEELIRVKAQIRNIVDLAYEVANSNFNDSLSAKALEKNYGWLLKDAVNATKADIGNDLKMPFQNAFEFYKTELNSARTSVSHFKNSYINAFFISAENKSFAATAPFVEKAAEKASEGFVYNESSANPAIAYFSKTADGKIIVVAELGTRQIVKDAMERSKSVLRKLVYSEGEGYVFVNNLDCMSVVHPFQPEIEGTDFSKVVDGKGKKFVPEMVDICKTRGRGYVYYYWPKYEAGMSAPPPMQKISYVRLFEPWGWVIGSGAYIDNIRKLAETKKFEKQEQVNELIFKVLISSVLITFGMILFSIFFAETISKPIVKMIDKMKSVKLDEITTSSVSSLKGSYELKELGNIFNGMLHSLNDGIKKIRETTSIKEKFESELNIARNIQLSLLPKTFPKTSDNAEFDVYGAVKSARTVGGDMYDFFNIDDNNICFAVGDVSDKGVPSSLFMALTRTLLRSKAGKNLTAGQIVTEMNKSLCENNDASMFVTFFIGLLNLKSGKLNYCNAGHNLPFLLRKHSKVENLPVRHGIPIGAMDIEPYYDDTVTLKPDDTLVIYTDGVVRGINRKHELFGDVRLKKNLQGCLQMTPKECVETIMEAVLDFTGNVEQEDDIAILAVSYCGRTVEHKVKEKHPVAEDAVSEEYL